MRGKAIHKREAVRVPGITPAYAGKSPSECVMIVCFTDHPRLCGEKLPSSGNSLVTLGSPPPMRGKAEVMQTMTDLIRITPAYAGKREVSTLRVGKKQDHPRLCGEKSICYDSTRPCLGSPPPMRGKVRRIRKNLTAWRITPAYAGKRIIDPLTSEEYQDHPRLCGEKFHSSGTVRIREGSPPPMRGKAVC